MYPLFFANINILQELKQLEQQRQQEFEKETAAKRKLKEEINAFKAAIPVAIEKVHQRKVRFCQALLFHLFSFMTAVSIRTKENVTTLSHTHTSAGHACGGHAQEPGAAQSANRGGARTRNEGTETCVVVCRSFRRGPLDDVFFGPQTTHPAATLLNTPTHSHTHARHARTQIRKDIIKQIQSMEKTAAARAKRPKEIDPTTSSGLGLLEEMSLAELRERLALCKRAEKEEEDRRRESILQAKSDKAAKIAAIVRNQERIRMHKFETAAHQRSEDKNERERAAADAEEVCIHRFACC